MFYYVLYNSYFDSDPELRPTASTLLKHPFVDMTKSPFDFNAWITEAMKKREREKLEKAANHVDSDETDSDYSSEYESE